MPEWEKKAAGDVEQALLEAAWAGDEGQCRSLALAGADMGSRMGYGSTIGAMGSALEAAGSDAKKLGIAIDWCYEGMWSAPSDEVWMACALALPAWAVGGSGDNALMAAGGFKAVGMDEEQDGELGWSQGDGGLGLALGMAGVGGQARHIG